MNSNSKKEDINEEIKLCIGCNPDEIRNKKLYKDEQEKNMKSYIIGAKDLSGDLITKVYARDKEVIVYEIDAKNISEKLRILIDTEDEENDEPNDNFAKVRGNYMKLKGKLYKVINDASVKGRIAHILVHSVKHPDEANNQFVELINEIDNEYKEQSIKRIKYLITTILIMLICIAASIITYNFSCFLDRQVIRELIFITCASSIGGFISITTRLNKTFFEEGKGVMEIMFIYFAIERMLVSITAGIILYFVIKSDISFGFVNDLEKPIFGYLLFATVAGFSETLIPNLLIKLESKE